MERKIKVLSERGKKIAKFQFKLDKIFLERGIAVAKLRKFWIANYAFLNCVLICIKQDSDTSGLYLGER